MESKSLVERLVSAAPRHAHRLAGPLEPMRAWTETMVSLCALPKLLSGGDPPAAQDVLVIPGVSGGPGWCAPLRTFLLAQGHLVHQPAYTTMKRPNGQVADRLEKQIVELASHSRRAAIIGWSAGGVFARQVALAQPHLVTQVITMGTPVGGWWYNARPGTANQPMPVPTLSIFSNSDPFYPPEESRQVPAPHCEDLEITSSHLGMATHPVSLHAISDRLRLAPGDWHPYHPPMPGVARMTAYSGH